MGERFVLGGFVCFPRSLRYYSCLPGHRWHYFLWHLVDSTMTITLTYVNPGSMDFLIAK
jgi:hypothetical protein